MVENYLEPKAILFFYYNKHNHSPFAINMISFVSECTKNNRQGKYLS